MAKAKAGAPGVPEAAVLRQVLDLLRFRRVPHWRMNSGAAQMESGRFVRFGVTGISDVLGLVPRSGRMLAVEVKRPGGKPTPAQRAFLRSVREAGGVALVISNICDLAGALALLEGDPHIELELDGTPSEDVT